MGYDVDKRGFDPDDYQVAARMGGIKKKSLNISKMVAEIKQLNEFTAIEKTIWPKMYRAFTSLYLKLYSKYRHMWE